jgi:hypothetical protein
MLELLIVVYTFWDSISEPNKFFLIDNYDGLKNYFHFIGYIIQNPNDYWGYSMTNYPFGESVFYLDSMPLFSVPLKFIHNNILDLKQNIIAVHNFILYINIIICFSLSYWLFSRLSSSWLLVGSSSIILSMTNPMLHRINYHFGLSFSSVIILFFILLYLLNKSFELKNEKNIIIWASLSLLLIYLSGFIHIYYIAILAMAFVFFIFFSLGKNHFQNPKYILTYLFPVLAVFLFLLTVRLADPYFSIRPTGGSGFDWQQHNFSLDALYANKSTPVQTLPFFIKSNYSPYLETFGYLGGFVLYSLMFFILLGLFRRFSLKLSDTFILSIFLTGCFCLFISLGNKIILFGNNGIKTDNWLSVFYWLSKSSEQITHFRVVGRFVWIFYYSIFVLVFFYWDRIINQKKIYNVALIVLLTFGFVDVYDWSNFLKISSLHKDTLSIHPDDIAKIKQIKLSEYKATYIFPYYQVGSSNLDMTLDDVLEVSKFAFRFTLLFNLPTCNHKASRTPDKFANFQLKQLENALNSENEIKPKQKYLAFLYNRESPKMNNFCAENRFYGQWKRIIDNCNGKLLTKLYDFDVYEIYL